MILNWFLMPVARENLSCHGHVFFSLPPRAAKLMKDMIGCDLLIICLFPSFILEGMTGKGSKWSDPFHCLHFWFPRVYFLGGGKRRWHSGCLALQRGNFVDTVIRLFLCFLAAEFIPARFLDATVFGLVGVDLFGSCFFAQRFLHLLFRSWLFFSIVLFRRRGLCISHGATFA